MGSLREILRMVIIDRVINTLLDGLPVCIVVHGSIAYSHSASNVLNAPGIVEIETSSSCVVIVFFNKYFYECRFQSE